MICFKVNGTSVNYEPKENDKTCLLDFIREELHLTGTKRGCEERVCNACTVLVDGAAKRSCALLVKDMDGKEITTIEGLASADGKLDPMQEAFIEYNAVQCGFCTPGMILAAKGLINQNPNPSEADIKKALKLNLCRCGTYPRVIMAVQKAAALARGEMPEPYHPLDLSQNGSLIGKSVPRLDLPDKVTGKTKFYGDYQFENNLYGKAVYPPYPFADILSIDTAPAYEVPGVQLVITADDVPGDPYFGVLCKDQPVMAGKRVRHIGETVAVVFADSAAAAAEGAARVKVEYRELPGVFSIEAALSEGAPLIPDPERPKSPLAYVAGEKGNLCKEAYLHRGNVDDAFAKCETVVEGDFHTKVEEHAWIEPDGAVSAYDENGVLCVYAPNQSPFADRDQLAAVLGLTKDEVRIIHVSAGGAFGGKTELTNHAFVAIATMKTGRPARMVNSRKDSLRTHPKRHPYDMHYKVGADREGRILAMEAELLSDSGAYASWTPRVLEQGLSYSTGPYYIPNLNLVMKGIYTNNMVKGAMRGFGAIQSHFGSECILDMLAEKTGIDPIRLREINGLERGLPMTTGQIVNGALGIDYKNTLKKSRELIEEKLQPYIDEERKKGVLVGLGVASGWRSVAGGLGPAENAGAIFELQPDGRVSYRIACTEMGQGSHTSLEQIAQEISGVAMKDLDIVAGDTKTVPFGGGVMASRGLFLWGHPTIAAGKAFKEKLIREAAQVLGVPEAELTLRESVFYQKKHIAEAVSAEKEQPAAGSGNAACAAGTETADAVNGEAVLDLRGLAERCGKMIKEEVDFYLPKTCPVRPDTNEHKTVPDEEYYVHHTVAYNTTLAVVRVDPESGAVTIPYMCAVCDGGQIINPDAAMTQIEGALIMGSGFGMSNDFKIENGINKTDSLGKCKMPRIDQIPEHMEVIFTEANDQTGPFGAKGIAEIAVLTPAPAICNAIYDAVGVRITELPVSDHLAELKAAAQERLAARETESEEEAEEECEEISA